MINKKMTMDDIAMQAGVAKSTVSRYFNGGSVKQSTKLKIQKVIEKYNYEPNTFARLNARQSNLIGVVVPTLNSKVTSRVMTSIDRYLRERDYATLIRSSDHDIELELQNIQKLIHLNVDGILISAIAITEEHRRIMENAEIPIVVMAQECESSVSIVDDDYRAGRCMGEYIGKRGHRNAAIISVDETDVAVGIRRKQGILDGLKAYGVDRPLVVLSDYSFAGGQAAAREILEKDRKVDAIICATDRLAFGAYRVLQEYGLRIPDDVSVVGFGGYEESVLLDPELTTLKFDSYAMGYLGAEALLKILNKEPVSKKQIIEYEFIEGRSVKDRN
ncbi:MAG: LacI family DNA-binding transcriptional regulator [Brotaphodocola sp.]